MNFEHVVIVNDPSSPFLEAISREELWFGLTCRAEDPRPFLPGLDSCTIDERDDNVLIRTLHFGQVTVRDRVVMEPLEWISFESEKTAEHAGGVLTITIEEPEPEMLVLRFSYRTSLAETAGDVDEAYAGFVQSAYHQSDIDTVGVIRMIVASGRIQ